jgi:hypothetical protein
MWGLHWAASPLTGQCNESSFSLFSKIPVQVSTPPARDGHSKKSYDLSEYLSLLATHRPSVVTTHDRKNAPTSLPPS